MKIYVTSKACHECFMTPERVLSSQEAQEFVEWSLHDAGTGHIPECHCVTLARQKWGPLPFPSDAITCCFAFFYCYGRQNIYLREAIEQGEIEYFSIDNWESLKESGRVPMMCPSTGKKWETVSITIEQGKWGEQVRSKCGKSVFSSSQKVELPQKP